MATTDFGFKTVDEQEKAQRVRGVFDSVASKYDVMNDLMSMGLHRAWKAYTVMVANLKPGDQVLDIAGGTGDMAGAFAEKVGSTGTVVHTDINLAMLREGRNRASCCPPRFAMLSNCHSPTSVSTWFAWPLACAT
jgi:demethylmenaquinone methyltransferase/2-methoxy-6-polyprenyl-1,4-benzoquinol methylase